MYAYFPFFSTPFIYVLMALWMAIFIGSFFKIRYFLSISFSLLLPIAGYLNAGFNTRANLNFDLKKTNTFVFEVIDFPFVCSF
jgi:hypothetical protein